MQEQFPGTELLREDTVRTEASPTCSNKRYKGCPTLAMPSSDSNANARASPVSPRCVPPQNSIEYCLFDGSSRFARSSSTGLPMETTLTGSGYCSPNTARSPDGPESDLRVEHWSARPIIKAGRSAHSVLRAQCTSVHCTDGRGMDTRLFNKQVVL